MKSVLDKVTRDELTGRISTINKSDQPQWGKMNTWQMLKHCTLWEDMIFQKEKIKQVFMGKIFGKIALKQLLKENSVIGKNMSTTPELIIKEKTGDVDLQKMEWINRMGKYATYNTPEFFHPFFGKMTREQVGQLAYKHADHHLRQFGA